jgi:hypothetical protein
MCCGARPGGFEGTVGVLGRGAHERLGPVPARGHSAVADELARPAQPPACLRHVAAEQRRHGPAQLDAPVLACACGRIAIRRLGLIVSAELLQRIREVVQCGRPRATLLERELERGDGLLPVVLLERDEAEVEGRAALLRPQLRHATELTQRLVEHPGPVEGDTEIAVLLDPGVAGARRQAGRRRARAAYVPGGDEAIERLPHLELHHAGLVDQLLHVPRAIEQGQELLLRLGERHALFGLVGAVGGEQQVETRDLLLDQAPLVHPARAFEQQPLRVDLHEKVLPIGTHAGLEVERAGRPGEQEVDRFLDLQADVVLQLLAGEHAHAHEDLAQARFAVTGLGVDGVLQLLQRDALVPDQHVAQAVPAVDDRRIADPAILEPDVAEVLAVGDGETPRAPPEVQQLDDIGEARLPQAALDRHQRHSSMTQSARSGQCQAIFSRTRAARLSRAAMPNGSRAARRTGRPVPSRSSRAMATVGSTRCASAGEQYALHETLRRPHRVGGPRREVSRQLRVDLGATRGEEPLHHVQAQVAVGGRQLHHEAALEPGQQPGLDAGELGERHRGSERQLSAGFGEDVEEEEEFFLRALPSGDGMHVVEQQRAAAAIAIPPPDDGITVDGLDQPLRELVRRQTRHAGQAGLRQRVASPCSRCVFPTPGHPR